MRKIFTFFFLFIIGFAFGQNTFKTRLTTSGNDFAFYKTLQLNNGDFVCVGYTNKSNSADDGDIVISQFDKQGVLITSKTIGTSGYDEGYAAIKTADGGIAISGTLNDGMALLKFNANLSLQWAKRLTVKNASTYGAGLVQTSDGSYMVTGALYTNKGSAGYLVKMDSAGNVMLSKKYFDIARNAGIQTIAATTDGNYALLAGTQNSSSQQIDTTYLLKIKLNGSIIWSRYINDSTFYTSPFDITASADGGIVIGGSAEKQYIIQGTTHSHEHMLMTKFNANGKMLWSKSIETQAISKSYPMSVIEDKDGSYICSGELDTYDNNNNRDSAYAYAAKLSSSGALQWTKTFDAFKGDIYYSELDNLIRTSDGGYAACGIGYYSNGNKNFAANFLYKFNANMETCDGRNVSLGTLANVSKGVIKSVTVNNVITTATNVSVATAIVGTATYVCSTKAKLQQPLGANAISQSKAFSISPNPVQQILHVELQSSYSSKIMLQITDVSGRMIFNQQTYTTAGINNIIIPVASLSKGIYILKVVQNNNIQAVKFIKQ